MGELPKGRITGQVSKKLVPARETSTLWSPAGLFALLREDQWLQTAHATCCQLTRIIPERRTRSQNLVGEKELKPEAQAKDWDYDPSLALQACNNSD